MVWSGFTDWQNNREDELEELAKNQQSAKEASEKEAAKAKDKEEKKLTKIAKQKAEPEQLTFDL